MLKRQRRKLMLLWRLDEHAGVEPTAQELADSVSCEWLPWDEVPEKHQRAVTEFRHLTQASRVKACRAFLRKAVRP